MSPIAIIIWVGFAVIFAAIFIQKFKGKQQYKNVEFHNDPNWLENSIAAYPQDEGRQKYFYHFDKEYTHQGHVVEDEQHNVVYEQKILYNNGFNADESDFVNHMLNTTHHHKVGKVTSGSIGFGNVGATVGSSFTFDGEDIFAYLASKGYSFRFQIKGLGYHIDILKDGATVARIYSSNNGKNLYERSTPEIEEKAGGKGLYVLECAYSDFDIVALYAMAFSKVEINMSMFH